MFILVITDLYRNSFYVILYTLTNGVGSLSSLSASKGGYLFFYHGIASNLRPSLHASSTLSNFKGGYLSSIYPSASRIGCGIQLVFCFQCVSIVIPLVFHFFGRQDFWLFPTLLNTAVNVHTDRRLRTYCSDSVT